MRARLLIPAALLAGFAVPAAAGEDFTGFYAGVNAGYSFGRGAAERLHGVAPASGVRPKTGTDLPPSAARAADRTAPTGPRTGR